MQCNVIMATAGKVDVGLQNTIVHDKECYTSVLTVDDEENFVYQCSI